MQKPQGTLNSTWTSPGTTLSSLFSLLNARKHAENDQRPFLNSFLNKVTAAFKALLMLSILKIERVTLSPQTLGICSTHNAINTRLISILMTRQNIKLQCALKTDGK